MGIVETATTPAAPRTPRAPGRTEPAPLPPRSPGRMSDPLNGTAFPKPEDLSLQECSEWVLRAMAWVLPVDDLRSEFVRRLASRIKEFAGQGV